MLFACFKVQRWCISRSFFYKIYFWYVTAFVANMVWFLYFILFLLMWYIICLHSRMESRWCRRVLWQLLHLLLIHLRFCTLLSYFNIFIALLLWMCQAFSFAWTGALPEVLWCCNALLKSDSCKCKWQIQSYASCQIHGVYQFGWHGCWKRQV